MPGESIKIREEKVDPKYGHFSPKSCELPRSCIEEKLSYSLHASRAISPLNFRYIENETRNPLTYPLLVVEIFFHQVVIAKK